MSQELKERALKITEALYRSTDLFSDAEPLKWSLRKDALEILNVQQQDVLRLEELVKIISLKLDLASSGTFISKTNFEVIKRAYGELLVRAVSVKDSYKNLLDPPIPARQLAGGAIAMRQVGDILSDKKVEAVLDNDQAVGADMTERRKTLISALKQKSPLGVSDLTRMLGESGVAVSEKTVQRELVTLVASGAIRQEGDKRWRRYFIGSPDASVGAPTPV